MCHQIGARHPIFGVCGNRDSGARCTVTLCRSLLFPSDKRCHCIPHRSSFRLPRILYTYVRWETAPKDTEPFQSAQIPVAAMSTIDEDLRRKASSHFSLVTDTSEATLVSLSAPRDDPCVNFSTQMADLSTSNTTDSSRNPSISVTVVNSANSSTPRSANHSTLRRLTTRMRTAPARHMSKHRPLLHKAHNKMRYGWGDFIRIRGSIVPHVFLPTTVLTLWCITWLLLHKSAGWTWFLVSNQLVTILGVVMSLLLVFRTNTAYDRYWEGMDSRSGATFVDGN